MGGGLPLEGVVAEKFVPSLESLSSLGFKEKIMGCPGNFARCPGRLQVFKKFVQKKVRAHFSFPSCQVPKKGQSKPKERRRRRAEKQVSKI